MCFCFEKEEEEKIGWRFRSGIVVSRSDLVNTCEADYLFVKEELDGIGSVRWRMFTPGCLFRHV
jgi:hypothetical protein